jgi:hypothetical protein
MDSANEKNGTPRECRVVPQGNARWLTVFYN